MTWLEVSGCRAIVAMLCSGFYMPDQPLWYKESSLFFCGINIGVAWKYGSVINHLLKGGLMKKEIYEAVGSKYTISPHMEWIISSERDLDNWALDFVSSYWEDYPVVLLKGEMGSGKTTLVKSILRAMNGDIATSPTFSIVNDYAYPPDGRIYHFDLYRLNSDQELVEIGFEEYIDSGEKCLIEWPQLGEPYYQAGTATLSILVLSENERKITWQKGVDL